MTWNTGGWSSGHYVPAASLTLFHAPPPPPPLLLSTGATYTPRASASVRTLRQPRSGHNMRRAFPVASGAAARSTAVPCAPPAGLVGLPQLALHRQRGALRGASMWQPRAEHGFLLQPTARQRRILSKHAAAAAGLQLSRLRVPAAQGCPSRSAPMQAFSRALRAFWRRVARARTAASGADGAGPRLSATAIPPGICVHRGRSCATAVSR